MNVIDECKKFVFCFYIVYVFKGNYYINFLFVLKYVVWINRCVVICSVYREMFLVCNSILWWIND